MDRLAHRRGALAGDDENEREVPLFCRQVLRVTAVFLRADREGYKMS